MKKQLLFLSAFILSIASFSQNSNEDFKPSGDVLFKVFWNFHTDLSKDAIQKSAFELNRSYFGYKYHFNEAISAKITLDAGSNTGGSDYTVFAKIAQLDWKVAPSVKLSMGLIGLKQFNDQEDFWGYRYLYKSFQDEHSFGSSADLGINAEFKLSKTLKANFLIFNGEGYKKLQDVNGNQTIGGSLIFAPIEGLTTKIYVDNQPTTGSKSVSKLALFAGYATSDWRLGAEYNKLMNGKKYASPAVDHNLNGFSAYATYTINNKVELFGRFDQLSSNVLTGETIAWNNQKDGNQLITGVQYAPIKGLKFSLNYQGFNFKDVTVNNESLVFLNAEFKL